LNGDTLWHTRRTDTAEVLDAVPDDLGRRRFARPDQHRGPGAGALGQSDELFSVWADAWALTCAFAGLSMGSFRGIARIGSGRPAGSHQLFDSAAGRECASGSEDAHLGGHLAFRAILPQVHRGRASPASAATQAVHELLHRFRGLGLVSSTRRVEARPQRPQKTRSDHPSARVDLRRVPQDEPARSSVGDGRHP